MQSSTIAKKLMQNEEVLYLRWRGFVMVTIKKIWAKFMYLHQRLLGKFHVDVCRSKWTP